MARTRRTVYPKTVFAIRIAELQKKNNYSNAFIINNVRDENELPILNSPGTYNKWKAGERLPEDLPRAIVAFANFYNVSTDYLLLESAPETPQIKSVQDATGLSVESVKNIMAFNKDYPEIMRMIDTIFSYCSGEGSVFIINLYNQILNDYKDLKNKDGESAYNLDKMQSRFFVTQHAYNYISSIVMNHLSDFFDKQIKIQEEADVFYEKELADVNIDHTQITISPSK